MRVTYKHSQAMPDAPAPPRVLGLKICTAHPAVVRTFIGTNYPVVELYW